MKNLIILLVTIFICKIGYSQCTNIVDIDDVSHANRNGYYYKDTHNTLNLFEGHYKYTNGNTSFEIILEKMEMSNYLDRYCEDILIGAYKYIKDGVLVYDKLNDLDNNYTDGAKHIISGNLILTGQYRGCDECADNEKRVVLSIGEPEASQYYDLHVRKIQHNGQEAIKILLQLDIMTRTRKVGDPPLPELKLPFGEELILIKQ